MLKSLYFPNADAFLATRRRRDSWAWAGLIHGIDTLKKAGRWVVGDGTSINIEKDNWLVTGGKAGLRDGTGVVMVKDLIDQDRRAWDVEKVRRLFNNSSILQVLQTPIWWTEGKDKFIWPHSKSGIFSVKSGYHVIKRMEADINLAPSSSSLIPEKVWHTLWQLPIPQKIKIFLRKAALNILPVRENLAKRKLVTSRSCPICGEADETVEHAFSYVIGLDLSGLAFSCNLFLSLQMSLPLLHGWRKYLIRFYRILSLVRLD